MYRKGKMRHKNYKREKDGGGGMARDSERGRTGKKEVRNSDTAVKNCLDSCVRRFQYVKIN